jgi:rhamnosyltransferase
MTNDKVSIIIPTINAEKFIRDLLLNLLNQTRRPDEIIIIDSESDDKTVDICEEFGVKLISIKRVDFDHGATRDTAFRASTGDFVLFLTQDAIPVNDMYVANIINPFHDEKVAMVTGRQIARSGASESERLTREFNYPKGLFIRSKDNIKSMGIKTFFSSDCCSAYRRSAYMDVGGFGYPTLIGEDLVISARFIIAGYKTAHCGDAEVYHSHKYSLKQQYSRNFDIAANISLHEDLFSGYNLKTEGIRMVIYVIKGLLRKLQLIQALYYCLESAVKFLGYKHGRSFYKFETPKILKKTMNKSFWT